jgi:uncharacterized membrane protein YczE
MTETTTILTDAEERALLRAHEARIGRPWRLPLLAAAWTAATRSLRAATRWLDALIPRDRRLHRLTQLQAGLVLYGISDALLLMSGLGATPWDVFHQGLAHRLHTGVGTMMIIVGVLVMLLWIPLRQKPGFGTLSNVIVIGLVLNATLSWLATPHALWLRWTVLLTGILLNGIATGAYIGAGMGPGPRDGLMTGYAAQGHSIRLVRTSIELLVTASGWLLGGTVGLGTALFALGIGPLAHVFIPMFTLKERPASDRTRLATRDQIARRGRGRGPRRERRIA